MNNTLLLGSNSRSRKMLLTEAQIPFKEIGHTADESKVDRALPFLELIPAISRYKMEHVVLQKGKEGEIAYILTADTMGITSDGVVQGKAKDKEDAIKMLKALGKQCTTATAFCLDKKIFKDGVWNIEQRIEKVVQTHYDFNVPDHWVERYFTYSPGLSTASAIAVELYGAQFLQSINGSYTTIVGLPMFELREALEIVGFGFFQRNNIKI